MGPQGPLRTPWRSTVCHCGPQALDPEPKSVENRAWNRFLSKPCLGPLLFTPFFAFGHVFLLLGCPGLAQGFPKGAQNQQNDVFSGSSGLPRSTRNVPEKSCLLFLQACLHHPTDPDEWTDRSFCRANPKTWPKTWQPSPAAASSAGCQKTWGVGASP